ncbi:MAG: NFACT family protein [Thaumarchaeota archaeon]|nr:NFACT family protein [Nitrososphaerota archaeon]
MEISAIEIQILCQRIAESVSDYFVSGLYSMEKGALLRLNHSTKPEKLVAISSFANWITTKNLSIAQATKFVSRLRTQIERDKITSVEQVGNERIARFRFESRKGDKKNLFTEFFSHGNLILTDDADKIMDVESPQTFRHRSLTPGEKYLLPPSRGLALQDVDVQGLRSLHQESTKKGESLYAVKWFGRSIGTSRKFVEEIFARANSNPEKPANLLDDNDLLRLASACQSLIRDLKESQAGHILIPSDESEIEIDVCGIIPRSWNLILEKGFATIRSFPSLSEALDEVQIQALVLDRRRSVSIKARAKAAELSSALAKQSSQFDKNLIASAELRELARRLMAFENSAIVEDQGLIDKLLYYELIDISETSNGQPRFLTEPRSFLKSYTATSLASRLFDEAKRMDSVNQNLKQIMETLESQKDNLLEKTRLQEEKAQRKIVTERRERQWFERYRWFVTSDDRLVVGGRDSTSNSIVINKYTEKNDVVFHADLHGSPFFVLKNRDLSLKWPDDEIALEVAQATVGFSRAWKDELGSADAYWIFPDQISKSPPSGEYLARGSFFIEGKKNFIRHVKVELTVGLTTMSKIPKEDKTALDLKNDLEKPDSEQVIVVCGPDKSISGICFSIVRIAPGKEKGSEFARRLKQQLVSRIKDEDAKEMSKKIQVDDIMRVLPSGAYKLVSEKRNQ